MSNLLLRLVKRHMLFLGFTSVLLGWFQFLMCGMVSTVNVSGALEELMKSVPPFFRSIIEDQFLGGATTTGILAFAWNHPITLALGTAVAIVLAARAVAGEIEDGVLELVLSQPLSRVSYLGGHIVFALMSLAFLSLVGLAGTVVGQRLYGLEIFTLPAMSKLAVNFFLLQCAWYGIALVFSVFAREAGRVAMTAFLIAVVSYLMQVIGRFWVRADFLLPYSINTYYSPQAILVDNILAPKSIAVLSSIFVVSAVFAVWHFRRRDIP